MLSLHIQNETSALKAVVLGTAKQCGSPPSLETANDPQSKKHLIAGTYPRESDMIPEMQAVEAVLKRHGVEVFRPEIIPDYYQIFSRDIGFVIEDRFIKSNILPSRSRELSAIQYVLDQLDPEKIVELPDSVHVEGGDVILHNDYIFVGMYDGDDYGNLISARTNPQAVEVLRELFPQKVVKAFNLRKSDTDPHYNALHLDCCFQPVGINWAIIHKNGFLNLQDVDWLMDYFGRGNVFEITVEEMTDMNSNIFSVSEEVVISEKGFTRLNKWLSNNNIQVEEVSYSEIAKQSGLLRCSTLPLIRE